MSSPKKKRKRKKNCYVVLSKERNYRYGAFPYTEEGFKMAEEFVKKIKKSNGEELYIVEK